MAKREIRFFNTTGPCDPDDHYMLPPEDRLVGAQLHRYIKDKLYWVLHAPRQTGKTTFLQSWMRQINSGTDAIACYVTVEACQGVLDPEKSMPTICYYIKQNAQIFGVPVPDTKVTDPNSMLSDILSNWAKLVAPKSLIVLFDEVDTLMGETLISFLRQLRGGFAGRGVGTFPISIVLVGLRDLRDYIMAAKDGIKPNPGSPFNIKADSAVLSNFNKDDIAKLFAQRTQEIGQKISQDALDYAYEQSKGQPWIVNSLFMRATLRILTEKDNQTINKELLEQAREQMILARETHLDALAYRLDDPKVFKVIETLMIGEPDEFLAESEEFNYCMDLGLVAEENGTPIVANPIYREVLARKITQGPQAAIVEPEWQWEKADGSLDMDRLLKEFQIFWRENADIWEERRRQRFRYTEAFPHLLVQAFLQRVLNGGGHIDREYAAGRGSLDLCVQYNKEKFIIEIKMLRDYNTFQQIKEKGLHQITKYRNTIAPKAPAYLVIFDRCSENKRATWDERITWTQESDGIIIVGC
jgi:hypothetical protein